MSERHGGKSAADSTHLLCDARDELGHGRALPGVADPHDVDANSRRRLRRRSRGGRGREERGHGDEVAVVRGVQVEEGSALSTRLSL